MGKRDIFTLSILFSSSTVPSRPFNVSFRGVTNSSVAVRWQRPRHPNGIVQGYRLYYVHKNFTDVQTVRDPDEDMEHTLQGLGEYIYNRK